jgi:glycerate kinase
MNILIAPDSFKDCMSSREVAKNIETGIKNVMPDAGIKILPLADGGEGTVEALVDATKGEIRKVQAHDPLMRKIDSFIGILGDKKTVVIEMAAASGIELLKESERNPWITTTYGTGELINHALDAGCKNLVIGIGGSSTNDAGVGMVQALGGKFIDSAGKEIGYGGGCLGEISEIDISDLDSRIKNCSILVACDVDNPLYGEKGAAMVYSPQKGAGPEMAVKLDRNLRHFAELVKQTLHIDIAGIPGSGAAGGIGAGLMAFMGARLKPGFEIVKDIVRLEEEMEKADIVITGEGKIDYQTQYGKAPFGVAQIAVKYKKPVAALAGILGERYEELYSRGFDMIIPIAEESMDLEESIRKADILIQSATERIIRVINAGRNKR